MASPPKKRVSRKSTPAVPEAQMTDPTGIQVQPVERKTLRNVVQLAAGGEGIVYRAEGPSGTCAFKRYHDRILVKNADARHRKLRAMVVNAPIDPTASVGHVSLVWPSRVVYEEGRFVGYLMPLMPKDTLTFAAIMDRQSRSENNLSNWTWRELLTVGRNLASAVEALHERDVRWGDLNEENVLVNPAGYVTLCDLDTAAMRFAGEMFPGSGVTRLEWKAPEMEAGKFFTQEGDKWALAILLYTLLMESFLPFACQWTGEGDAPKYSESIALGRAPILDASLKPTKGSPPLDMLPPRIQLLFKKCFGVGRTEPNLRPTAEDFCDAIDHTLKALKNCSKSKSHVYWEGRLTCPWCERSNAGRRRRAGKQVPVSAPPSMSNSPQALPSIAVPQQAKVPIFPSGGPPPPPPPPPPGGTKQFVTPIVLPRAVQTSPLVMPRPYVAPTPTPLPVAQKAPPAPQRPASPSSTRMRNSGETKTTPSRAATTLKRRLPFALGVGLAAPAAVWPLAYGSLAVITIATHWVYSDTMLLGTLSALRPHGPADMLLLPFRFVGEVAELLGRAILATAKGLLAVSLAVIAAGAVAGAVALVLSSRGSAPATLENVSFVTTLVHVSPQFVVSVPIFLLVYWRSSRVLRASYSAPSHSKLINLGKNESLLTATWIACLVVVILFLTAVSPKTWFPYADFASASAENSMVHRVDSLTKPLQMAYQEMLIEISTEDNSEPGGRRQGIVLGGGVSVRESPSSTAKKVGSVAGGDTVTIVCTENGESIDGENGLTDVWNRIAEISGFVSDAFVRIPPESPSVPEC